ncbi:MAG: hypothetical protein HY000_41170 [Planctomycetes bacterium]|nr:hypothetical protein [Planctomycetota bacterium]
MATIVIPELLVQQIEELREAGVISSAKEFAEDAIREKLSAARLDQLTVQTRALKEDLASSGLTPDLLLNEFERFRHATHNNR